MGRSVNVSTRVLGAGQRISRWPTVVFAPMPSTMRGSWLERKLPPPDLSLLPLRVPAFQVTRAPIASMLAYFPTSVTPSQWFPLALDFVTVRVPYCWSR
jgi:hypothetical protein